MGREIWIEGGTEEAMMLGRERASVEEGMERGMDSASREGLSEDGEQGRYPEEGTGMDSARERGSQRRRD